MSRRDFIMSNPGKNCFWLKPFYIRTHTFFCRKYTFLKQEDRKNPVNCTRPIIAMLSSLILWFYHVSTIFEQNWPERLIYYNEIWVFMGLSINDITHLEGGGSAKRWCYSINLFRKMGNKGREGSKMSKMGDVIFGQRP